jgi:hypothetical protein
MERKQFLKASLCLGALCGARSAIPQETKPEPPESASASASQPSACERNAEFARGWVRSFMEILDAQLSEPERVALLEARGRACARSGAVRMAEAHKGDLDGFMAAMASHMGPDGLRREDSVVKVKYPTCYCPLASQINEPLSASYCACSVGWLKEMYETVTNGPVTVEVLETVKRGGKVCRFDVTIEG